MHGRKNKREATLAEPDKDPAGDLRAGAETSHLKSRKPYHQLGNFKAQRKPELTPKFSSQIARTKSQEAPSAHSASFASQCDSCTAATWTPASVRPLASKAGRAILFCKATCAKRGLAVTGVTEGEDVGSGNANMQGTRHSDGLRWGAWFREEGPDQVRC